LIRTFRDAASRDIFEGRSSKRARRCLPVELWPRARLKLDELDAATDLRQLRLPSNRLEKLVGNRSGEHAVRINRQFRICFRWSNADAWDVEITDYH
jgi:toxin HigB-1